MPNLIIHNCKKNAEKIWVELFFAAKRSLTHIHLFSAFLAILSAVPTFHFFIRVATEICTIPPKMKQKGEV